MNIKDKYEKRLKRFQNFYDKLKKPISLIVALKLAVIFGGIAAVILLYIFSGKILSAAAAIAVIVLYVLLNNEHDRLHEYQGAALRLIEINGGSLKRLNGEWKSFEDTGKDFLSEEHPFSGDLDIFGQSSLFQFINTAQTILGRKRLAGYLSSHPDDLTDILKRQKTIIELSKKLGYRQKYNSECLTLKKKNKELFDLIEWGKNCNEAILAPRNVLILKLIPALTILLLLFGAVFRGIPLIFAILLLIANYILLKNNGKERIEILTSVFECKDRLKKLERLLQLIERHKFQSDYLTELKSNLLNSSKELPSAQIRKLAKISDSIASRYNFFYFIFNVITLWDYQCQLSLEIWKKNSGRFIEAWLDAIGDIEALSSLAGITFDNPDWVMPKFKEPGNKCLIAGNLGHPLLTHGRIGNDFRLNTQNPVLLITGSNMSGKSTFLRTAGINLILAYAGARVCAREFQCSLMNVYTCMRIADNLEKNISSFYAEILRVKLVIEAVEKGENVFFLLDEIFKGTNSSDRHTAAKAIISRLVKSGTLGLVSTHDLELGELEQETKGAVANYHFQETYIQNSISFDYRLRPGISKTRNAIYLIRAAGIDIGDDAK